MEISEFNYDEFTLELILEEDELFNLNVKLGLAPELEVYQINSKTKLSEEEILSIMKCVKRNRREFNQNCSDQKKYYVTMHL